MLRMLEPARGEADPRPRSAPKRRTIVDIKCLRTFQAVVACGTYAKAADQLGYTQSTVTVHIKKIREKVEMDTSNPQYIETIWGVGYRFKV